MDKEKMRRDFEDWYESDCMPCEGDWFRRDPCDTDEYLDCTTNANWRGFKAAYRSSYRLGYLAGYKACRNGSTPKIIPLDAKERQS
jgi:hypothetical protein